MLAAVVEGFALFQSIRTASGAQLASDSFGIGGSFPVRGGGQSGRDVKLTCHLHLMLNTLICVHYGNRDTFTFTSHKTATCYRRSSMLYFLQRACKRMAKDSMRLRSS
jgi:hypothetical protein